MQTVTERCVFITEAYGYKNEGFGFTTASFGYSLDGHKEKFFCRSNELFSLKSSTFLPQGKDG